MKHTHYPFRYHCPSVRTGIFKTVQRSGGTGVIVGVEEIKGKVPEQFALSQNYPESFQSDDLFPIPDSDLRMGLYQSV